MKVYCPSRLCLFSIIKNFIYTDDKKPTLAWSIFLITLAMTCTINVHIHCDHMLLYKGNNCWPSTFFLSQRLSTYVSQIVAQSRVFCNFMLCTFHAFIWGELWLTVSNEVKALRWILLTLFSLPYVNIL